MGKDSTEDFIVKATNKYQDRYSFEDTLYTGSSQKLNITCKIHGIFSVRANDFLNGKSGCQECSGKKRITKKEFVEQATILHNGFYDYNKVKYINKNSNVTITCPIHGDFEQTPYSHLKSSNCNKCSIELSRQKRTDTKEDFLEKAKLIHGDTFDYSKVNYITSKTKVTITCKTHGDFEQKPNNHLTRAGCMKCAGYEKLNTNTFIEKANNVHNGLFDYSKVDYISSKQKVIITCRVHGDFSQQPTCHINEKHGCPKCAGLEKKTTLEFINKAKEVHRDLFDYSKSDYKGGKQKIIIGCKIHGDFTQQPVSHINAKQGCPKCGGTEKLTTTTFIEKAITVHDNFYMYKNTEYINNKIKVTITCPIHGDFSQNPSSHLQKVGCPDCNSGYYSLKRAERHKEKWEKIPAILYFLKIKTEDEEFYKIGLTKKTIDKRFSKDNFQIDVLREYNTNLYNACVLESVILHENKQYKYEPKTIFGGHTECFTKDILR